MHFFRFWEKQEPALKAKGPVGEALLAVVKRLVLQKYFTKNAFKKNHLTHVSLNLNAATSYCLVDTHTWLRLPLINCSPGTSHRLPQAQQWSASSVRQAS